ncbi:MAG: hypothetical protein K6F78_09505, partial [Bacteroidaceae bacterium]|nr:hypothetical protein [Bacteroidaceae bacterium]
SSLQRVCSLLLQADCEGTALISQIVTATFIWRGATPAYIDVRLVAHRCSVVSECKLDVTIAFRRFFEPAAMKRIANRSRLSYAES